MQREYLPKRLADVAIELYAMSASLSRATARVDAVGEEAAADHIRLAHTFCNMAWRRVRRSLRLIDHNPDRRFHEVVGWLRERQGFQLEG